MSENKNFKLVKTTASDVFFTLRPISNPNISREIFLSKRTPFQVLPMDWALGVFQDSSIFSLYQKGLITFENNKEIAKVAYESGVYFSDELDFEPAATNQEQIILEVIKSGNRKSIMDAIEKYGRDAIIAVAATNINNLSTGVVKMLETALKIQLTVDEDNISYE